MSSKVIRYDNIIPLETRQSIAKRYHRVTRAINQEFWNSTSETAHSLYVGSYGRNTAIDTSDIDILVIYSSKSRKTNIIDIRLLREMDSLDFCRQ